MGNVKVYNKRIGDTLYKTRKRLSLLVEDLLEDNNYRQTYLNVKHTRNRLTAIMEDMKNEDYEHLKIGIDE